MKHREDQWTLIFPEEVKHVVMLNARHEQFRPML